MPNLYVTPVPGKVVSRFGSATRTSNNEPIGYQRNRETGAFDLIDPEIVVMIPEAEATRFAAQYNTAIRVEGALIVRKEEDFKAWRAKVVARQEPARAAAPPAPPPVEVAELATAELAPA